MAFALCIMVMVVIMRNRRLQGTGVTTADGLKRIGFSRPDDADTPPGHARDETVTCAACNQQVGTVERMLVAVIETVHGHFHWQVETPDFSDVFRTLCVKEEKAACLTAMAGDGAKVLAGDCDFHCLYLMRCHQRQLAGGFRHGGISGLVGAETFFSTRPVMNISIYLSKGVPDDIGLSCL
jgi:hypothetical protein